MKLRIAVSSFLFLLVIAGLSFANSSDQPYMETARTDLQQAKAALQRAEHNKGGHRAAAIGYINSALAEVDRGIAYDRRHHHAQLTSRDSLPSLVADDQPYMKSALDRLQDAKTNLEAANADKGGHRVKALDYVDKAIDEVNKGIAAGE